MKQIPLLVRRGIRNVCSESPESGASTCCGDRVRRGAAHRWGRQRANRKFGVRHSRQSVYAGRPKRSDEGSNGRCPRRSNRQDCNAGDYRCSHAPAANAGRSYRLVAAEGVLRCCALISLGQDPGDLPYQIRQEVIPNAALFRTAGRGITSPEPGRSDIPYWVTTEAEARKAVQELAAK